jgi:hypothetical protein
MLNEGFSTSSKSWLKMGVKSNVMCEWTTIDKKAFRPDPSSYVYDEISRRAPLGIGKVELKWSTSLHG